MYLKPDIKLSSIAYIKHPNGTYSFGCFPDLMLYTEFYCFSKQRNIIISKNSSQPIFLINSEGIGAESLDIVKRLLFPYGCEVSSMSTNELAKKQVLIGDILSLEQHLNYNISNQTTDSQRIKLIEQLIEQYKQRSRNACHNQHGYVADIYQNVVSELEEIIK